MKENKPAEKNESLTEKVYGRQATGYPELDKDRTDIDPLTNREKTEIPGNKPETNPHLNKDNKDATSIGGPFDGRFMKVIEPDHSEETVKAYQKAVEPLKKDAEKAAAHNPKMGDKGENSTN